MEAGFSEIWSHLLLLKFGLYLLALQYVGKHIIILQTGMQKNCRVPMIVDNELVKLFELVDGST